MTNSSSAAQMIELGNVVPRMKYHLRRNASQLSYIITLTIHLRALIIKFDCKHMQSTKSILKSSQKIWSLVGRISMMSRNQLPKKQKARWKSTKTMYSKKKKKSKRKSRQKILQIQILRRILRKRLFRMVRSYAPKLLPTNYHTLPNSIYATALNQSNKLTNQLSRLRGRQLAILLNL